MATKKITDPSSGLRKRDSEHITLLISQVQRQNRQLQEQNNQLIQQTSTRSSYDKVYFLIVVILLFAMAGGGVVFLRQMKEFSSEKMQLENDIKLKNIENKLLDNFTDTQEIIKKTLDSQRAQAEEIRIREMEEHQRMKKEYTETKAEYFQQIIREKKEKLDIQMMAKQQELEFKNAIKGLEKDIQERESSVYALERKMENLGLEMQGVRLLLDKKDAEIKDLKKKLVSVLSPEEIETRSNDLNDDG